MKIYTRSFLRRVAHMYLQEIRLLELEMQYFRLIVKHFPDDYAIDKADAERFLETADSRFDEALNLIDQLIARSRRPFWQWLAELFRNQHELTDGEIVRRLETQRLTNTKVWVKIPGIMGAERTWQTSETVVKENTRSPET